MGVSVRGRLPTHGMSESKIYNIWGKMRRRCSLKSDKAYKFYGERGIKVCKRWQTFVNFFADMGHCPEGKSLERKNNMRGYSPSNCVWASDAEQCRNRRSNVFVSHNGKKMCLQDWAKSTGIPAGTIGRRMEIGWSAKDALTVPLGTRSRTFKFITFNGVTLTLSEWSKRLGAKNPGHVQQRIRAGWSVKKALTFPVASYVRKH
jgi:hypothetical protein